jgi:hypothetical protein
VRCAGGSTTQLGKHLDLSRQRIAVLADVEHVIVRLPNGPFHQQDAQFMRGRRISPLCRRDRLLARAPASSNALGSALQLLLRRLGRGGEIGRVVMVLALSCSQVPARAHASKSEANVGCLDELIFRERAWLCPCLLKLEIVVQRRSERFGRLPPSLEFCGGWILAQTHGGQHILGLAHRLREGE